MSDSTCAKPTDTSCTSICRRSMRARDPRTSGRSSPTRTAACWSARKGVFRVGADLSYIGEIAAETPPLSVVSMARSAPDEIWIGTLNGVVDFDGRRAQIYAGEESVSGTLPG